MSCDPRNSVDPSGLCPADIDYENAPNSALSSNLVTRDPNFMRGGFKFAENLSGAFWPINLATGTSGKSNYVCDLNTRTRLFNFGFRAPICSPFQEHMQCQWQQ